MDVRSVLDQREIDALEAKKLPQLLAEGVRSQPADQRRRCAEFCGGYRLVGALATWKIVHRFAGDGFTDLRMPVGGRHHIHVDAAGDEHAPHV
jgi:hypothetical protein